MYFTYSSMYLSVTISKFIPPHFPSGNRKFVFYICDSNSSSVVAQSCPTLCNLMDCSPPGSSVHEILQARILEWVAIPFFRGSSQSREILYHRSHQGSLDFKVYTYPNQILINLLFLKHGCLYKNSSTETLEPECFLNVGDHYSLIYA